jgi:hypothetical protein
MSPGLFSFWATVLIGPLAAFVGGIVVVLLTQDLLVGVTAGTARLAVGIVVGLEVSFAWVHRWPTEYDPVDEETWERAQRDREFESWPPPIVTVLFTVLFLGGTITALVLTLLAAWLLGG